MLLDSLINKIRLLRYSRQEPYAFWYNLLGYLPKDLSLYEMALTHKSKIKTATYSKTQQTNERLEYLGDAVIGVVVAEALFKLYPDKEEGFLTRARSKVVCREHLNQVAHDNGIAERLKIGQSLRDNADNVYGNAVEALVGAIYLDAGFEKAAIFIRQRIITSEKTLRKLVEKEVDFKSRLLEWAQATRATVEFVQLADRYDPKQDNHTFVCQIVVNGEPLTEGTGRTKRAAQQNASKKALRVVKMNKNTTK